MTDRQHMEKRVREALVARVEDVEPAPDALPRIRERTGARRGRWLPVFATATAVTAAIALGVVTFVPDRVPDTNPGPDTAATAVEEAPSNDAPSTAPSVPSTSGPSSPPAVGPTTASVPVYYAHAGKLYREYHSLRVDPATLSGRIAAAVGEMLRDGSPADPDYGTLWPTGLSVRGVTVSGGIATVDLSAAGAGPRGPADLAVQQLVWTVAAAAAEVSRVEGVRLLVAGAPVDSLWGTVDTSKVLRQASQEDVLASVWVIEPHQGAKVGRTFNVHLAGTVFEATVNLRIKSGGQVVKEQVVTLSIGAPSRGDAKVQLTLPPGRYTVEAFFISMEDSSEKALDNHEFTVA